jgi:hypothetical protein
VRACGSGPEPFELASFSQQFTAWLLPWIALISQLPFGAQESREDWMSIILTLGSPTLAAYSLALTVLNNQWLHEKFRNIDGPRRRLAIYVLNNLQQVPIRVVLGEAAVANGPDGQQAIPLQNYPAPAVIPNDAANLQHDLMQAPPGQVPLVANVVWWTDFARNLDYSDTWSLATAVSIGWVTVAYLFTVTGAFGSQSFNDVQRRVGLVGYGIASLWLWLLPLVVGWQRISPRCDYTRSESAVRKANGILEFNHPEPGSVACDQGCSPPIFNYARFLPWTRTVDDVYEEFHPTTNRRNLCRWDVIWRFTIASAFGLFLQWSTTSAAVLFAYFTPTRGKTSYISATRYFTSK